MRVLKRLLLLIVAVGVGFLVSKAFTKPVSAAEVGSEMEFQGVLESHPDVSYTHRLAGQNVNLNLGTSYSSMEGQEVRVRVRFVSTSSFSVLSVAPVGQVTQTTTTCTSGRATFQGVLVKNENPSYTHKLEGQNTNLILGSQYNSLEGRTVRVEVEFYATNRFRVVSVVGV